MLITMYIYTPHINKDTNQDWEMFRCFESLEFELSDASSSTTGFKANAQLDPDATSALASLI